ncbi:hypothetical protein [Marinobacterium lutimaris]|uniref:Uncharacterized protein n=1 Tax=Marinobacterium lutimaris TaxID=568106 RepID=A0A1H5XPA8_9GAMM|nr:hypothetical protein [Marinobacterium lutimaris]SEG13086.1 hypothetical protein SAMN05444390_1011442 [Marinobacterium lutimaris]
MSMNSMMATLEMGVVAIEVMEAKEITRQAREEYETQRNSFMAAMPREKWEQYVNDPAFQLCTRKSYAAYQKAKRQQYNAERRMERRFNKVKAVQLGVAG